MIPLQDSIANLGNLSQTTAADWAQLKTDRQAKNTDAVTADLQKLASNRCPRSAQWDEHSPKWITITAHLPF